MDNIVQCFVAQNPDYNVSVDDVKKFSAKLAKLGVGVIGIFGTLLGSAPGFSSPYPPEAELAAAGIPANVPINLQISVAGQPGMCQAGLLIKDFGEGDAFGITHVFIDIFGSWGVAQANFAMLNLPGVRDAVAAAMRS